MSEDRELLYFRMQLLQAEIAMQGMIAENKFREQEGRQIQYVEGHFMALIEKYGIHHNAFPTRGDS